MNQTFLEQLTQTLRAASIYNANDSTPPACVLWTDSDAQWQALFLSLAGQLPIFQLGEYDPESRTGPAYWLRCVIAGMFPDIYSPEQGVPILYLPGVSRQELRAVEDCPKTLQPLAELQYRGVIWTQKNGKDWTISAFLQSHDGGLGIEVSGDQATREALLRALSKLPNELVSELDKNAPLKASFFDSLVNPNKERSLLQWMNDPTAFRKPLTDQEWQAFCSICSQEYKFHPEKDGQLNAALLLGGRENSWKGLWERFQEVPAAYPAIPQLLRQVRPPQFDLFDKSECWPQDNETAEEELRDGLMSLSQVNTDAARVRIMELEKVHAPRRSWVWAKLGRSPLATALELLVQVVNLTKKLITGADVTEFAKAYQQWSWQVDAAVLQALEIAQRQGSSPDIAAIKIAVEAIYKPWLESSAKNFQHTIKQTGYPKASIPKPQSGTCILFSDALRMDLGQRLFRLLEKENFRSELGFHLSALPTITSTAKPALAPNQVKIDGKASRDLNPTVAGKASPLTADSYRKLLTEDGFQILGQTDLGDPKGIAWTETGQIDTYGHQHGIRLAIHAHDEINLIRKRVSELLYHGWKRVIIVTDHGWLLLPGGLPKAHLPEHLTEVRKGRCARLKEGSVADHQTLPWYWDANASIAFAPGISCYEAGKEYEHGGLSVQECVTPMITVESQEQSDALTFAEVKWKGLRCVVEIEGMSNELKADLRQRAGDPSTTIVTSVKSIIDGIASLVVENEDYIGKNAFIVIIDGEGNICAQTTTVVGG